MTHKILVIHGPNLNMLGTREPETYGSATLADINAALVRHGQTRDAAVTAFQSNLEGEMVEKIQQAIGVYSGLIINPAAYTHTSIAIRDAVLLLTMPVVEVHLSNIHKRESFRRHSYLSDVVAGQIVGFGMQGYLMALDAILYILQKS
ncbi:MAG: type II 3-dehydroquinate dehydratase [Desulfosalsimonadaceae bacterium]